MSDESEQQGAAGDGDGVDRGGAAGRDGSPDRSEGGPGTPRPAAHRSAGWAKRRVVRRRRKGWRRLLPTWRMVLGTGLFLVVAVGGLLVAGYLLVDIPKANSAALAQANVYLYADGSQLARDGEVNREKVSLSEIPKHTQQAVLAAEDRNFYSESAVDLTAMVRAGWNMLQGGGKQSGSTITQQYVKNYYLDQEQTLTRKAKEFFIAVKLDREVSKDDILSGYLNTSYFGRNSYGIQAASRAYYGKPASELTVAEGAYLAAVVNAPGVYDTHAHPDNRERAVHRWNYVLDGMVEQGWLEKEDRRRLTFPEPDPFKPPNSLSGQRGYLVEAVRTYLEENDILTREQLEAGGYKITTTIDRHKQQALVDAVDEKLLSRRDEDRKEDALVRAGGTSIDPATGKVVAMYGGLDYVKQYTNGATRRDYQVGSTFKPVVLTSAIEHRSKTQDGRRITPDTRYDGTSSREVVGPEGGTGFSPENEDDRSYGQIPVSKAMDKSVNSVFAQMGVDVGPDKVRDTAIRLGLPDDTPGLKESQGAISLGTATASTLDMAQLYAALADHGRHTPYRMVEKIIHEDQEVKLPEPDTQQAVSRKAADTTTAVLLGVVKGGTGQAAKEAGRPAAGKTGTAEEDKAAWFAGYTPDLATVIAVQGQHPKTAVQEPLYGALGEKRINGGGPPAQIWAAYTAEALRDVPKADFDLEKRKDAHKRDSDRKSTGTERSSEPGEEPDDEESEPEETDPTTEPPASEDPGTSEPPGSGEPTSPTGPPTGEPTGEPTNEPTGPPSDPGAGSPTLPPEPEDDVGGGSDPLVRSRDGAVAVSRAELSGPR